MQNTHKHTVRRVPSLSSIRFPIISLKIEPKLPENFHHNLHYLVTGKGISSYSYHSFDSQDGWISSTHGLWPMIHAYNMLNHERRESYMLWAGKYQLYLEFPIGRTCLNSKQRLLDQCSIARTRDNHRLNEDNRYYTNCAERICAFGYNQYYELFSRLCTSNHETSGAATFSNGISKGRLTGTVRA